jgi:zinc protease
VNIEKFHNHIRKYFILLFIWFFTILFLPATDVYAVNANRTVLPNGLIVLHSENHNLPIVMVTLIVKAGQVNEPAEKAGLANLAAELLSEGTKTRTSKVISEETDFIGASLDASAGSDYTTVTLSVLKKDVNKGFDLCSDILLNPSFPAEEIDRKKDIIKGSLKQHEEEPSFLAERAFRKEIFGEHPYGRLIEGSVETINAIQRDDLINFHKYYFLPNNSILSVVGDLTQEELIVLLEKYLGGWKSEELLPRVAKKSEGSKARKVIKIEKDLTQANIILGNPGIGRENPDYYAVTVMNYILGGGGFSSRLMQTVREKMGLAYDVHSFFATYKETGSFQAGVQTKNESANAAIDEILKQIEKMKKEEVSEQELSEAKAYLTGSFPRRLDTNRKISDFLASIEFYNLGLNYDRKYIEYINSVTKEDVLRVSGKYLDPENGVLVVVADQKKAQLKY